MKRFLPSPRVAALGLAIVSAALGSAVYHSSVFSRFVPIRIEVLGAELYASRPVATIALPDLSGLRGETVVLGLRLRNAGPEKRIGVLRRGFPRNRLVLPPDGTTRWDIVLSPEAVQALETDGPRSLELTSTAPGWTVTGVEFRNYHVRWGDRLMTAVLPRGADQYTPATGAVPVAIALWLLALANALLPRHPGKGRRLTGHGLALTAFVVCLTCLVLPRLSPYKVLFAPPAFALVAAGLFSPVLLHAAQALGRWTLFAIGTAAGRFAVLTRVWSRHEVTFERGAALLGLTAIGIAQPVFDVVSNSPEFFAARGTRRATAVAAVLAICFGVPLALAGIERALRMASRVAAATFHGLALALLTAAVTMPALRRSDVLVWPWDAVGGALIGLAVALAYARVRIVRQFLSALAPAALIVPTLFLFHPDVRRSLERSGSAASVQAIERTPPVVLVVFDELPLNSLLAVDGQIDAERYPNFAALARGSYWFRNASTVAHNTSYALPAILSGRYPTTSRAVPTLRYYPANLFTMLAPHYDIFASMRFQQLCPPGACRDDPSNPGDTVELLLSDLGLVWLHIVLPPGFTEELPAVDGDWAEFGRTPGTRGQGVQSGRAYVFNQFVSSIDDRPARLYFVHSMLPHMPFEYVPSGRRYRAPDQHDRTYRGKRLFEGRTAAYTAALYQRHLAQVGLVDRLVGELIARLREAGTYDKALVIVTADHGASYREGRPRRSPQHDTLSDVLQVPLLVKVPGQRRGEVVDRIVESVDILPTILDVVGAKAPQDLDGRSLVDGRVPERSSRTFILRNRENAETRPIADLSAGRAASLARKERMFGRGDLTPLYAPPDARHLLGRSVDGPALQPDVQIRIHDPEQFATVRRDRDPLPIHVRGVLSTSRPEPLSVAVGVNGIVAAVTHSYRDRGAHVFSTLIPETSLREGHNAVTAFAVDLPVTDAQRTSSVPPR